jgi:hypothetical protein
MRPAAPAERSARMAGAAAARRIKALPMVGCPDGRHRPVRRFRHRAEVAGVIVVRIRGPGRP